MPKRNASRRSPDCLVKRHPFEICYNEVEEVDWETWREVLDAREKWRVLSVGWEQAE
jgi:hypothetical protein